jgi:hypothetical protein
MGDAWGLEGFLQRFETKGSIVWKSFLYSWNRRVTTVGPLMAVEAWLASGF